MTLEIEVPKSLDEELTQQAAMEGTDKQEHATLLLYLATALLRGTETTPFREAVKVFRAQHPVEQAMDLDYDTLLSSLPPLDGIYQQPGRMNRGIHIDENGVAWITGTTTKVIEVALTKQSFGLTPEELQAELPHLSLAQVYEALAYYYAHQEAVDAEIERRYQAVEKLRLEAGESAFARRMRAEGKLH
jgi:uncharacterized protein (DUF433 family)